MIEVRNILAKSIVRKGKIHHPENNPTTTYHADIEEGRSIRIFGRNQNKVFDITFMIGNAAVYDSYNIVYTGQITQISARTVTITEYDSKQHGARHRLDLHEFAHRNYNFDMDVIAADNETARQAY